MQEKATRKRVEPVNVSENDRDFKGNNKKMGEW